MLSDNQEIRMLLRKNMCAEDAEKVLTGLDELLLHNKIVMENAERSEKASDRRNGGRVFGTNVYVSLTQLKENILQGIPALLLKFGMQPDKIIENSFIKILPQVISAFHVVNEKESCIFVEAIEFYCRDKKFHSIEEFIPKLAEDSACDNLDVKCRFRRQERCGINVGDVAEALDTLSKKHILEKRFAKTERNISYEYRYCKW